MSAEAMKPDRHVSCSPGRLSAQDRFEERTSRGKYEQEEKVVEDLVVNTQQTLETESSLALARPKEA